MGLYNRIMGVHRGAESAPGQGTPLSLDRQHSPTSPLDIIESVDALAPRPCSGECPSKSTGGVPSSGELRGDPTAAAGLPKLHALGSCAKSGDGATTLPVNPLVSAFAATASCPPDFFGESPKLPGCMKRGIQVFTNVYYAAQQTWDLLYTTNKIPCMGLWHLLHSCDACL